MRTIRSDFESFPYPYNVLAIMRRDEHAATVGGYHKDSWSNHRIPWNTSLEHMPHAPVSRILELTLFAPGTKEGKFFWERVEKHLEHPSTILPQIKIETLKEIREYEKNQRRDSDPAPLSN